MNRMGVVRFLMAFLSLVSAGLAQVEIGLQPHGTLITKGADTINVGNNNVYIPIPIMNKTGRGLPMSYALSFNSSVWTLVPSGSTQLWQPVVTDGSALGWTGLQPASQIGAGYHESYAMGNCQQQNFQFEDYVFVAQSFTNQDGVPHALNDATIQYFQGPTGEGCPSNGPEPSASSAVSTHDGSDYKGTMTINGTSGANSYATFQLTSPSGTVINPQSYSAPAAEQGAVTQTDANGNVITDNFGQITDTTGNVALTVAYQAAEGTLGSQYYKAPQTTLTYNTPNNGTAVYTVTYLATGIATNFGCTNIGEYGPTAANLVNQVILPDGSFYQFNYESTPGNIGYFTGRVKSVTLPTGGTIQYTYTGGSNGISCTDGSTPILTRKTTDGTSTYTRVTAAPYSTTVTDEKSNQSVYNFATDTQNDFIETQRQIYQGSTSGTLLEQVVSCYVSESNCASVTGLGQGPITEVDSTSTMNGLDSVLTKVTYDSAGAVVENVAQYSGSTLLENTSYGYNIVNSIYELASTTVTDGSKNTVALTTYGYDETTPAATSGLPQHTVVSGARGNQTSVHTSIDGTQNNMLSSTTAYYDTGQPVSTTTPNGKTSYTYDSTQAFTQGVSYPTPSSGVALSTSATYDVPSGAALTSVGTNSGTTQITAYDSFLRPTTIKTAGGVTISVTQGAYNSSSPTETTTEAGSAGSVTQYDTYGRTSRTALYNGQANATAWYQADTCYDGTGLVQYQSLQYAGPGLASGSGSTEQCSGVQYAYDALGRVTQTITADGTASTTYTGRAVETVDVTGTVKKITQYDLLGRISGVCELSSNASMPNSGSPVSCGMDITGTGFVTSYAYNLANHTTTITQGAQTRVFQTDAAGRSVKTTEPERGITSYTYAYNSTGLSVARIRPKANQTSVSTTATTTTQYDLDGRPISVTYNDGTPTKQLAYDASASGYYNVGQLTSASTMQGSTLLTQTQLNYDVLGNATSTTQCIAGHCGTAAFNIPRLYAYEPVEDLRMQESYYTGGTTGTRVDTNSTYSPAGEVLTMSNTLTGSNYNSGALISNMQNSAFGPSSFTFGNGLNGVKTYDSLGRPSGTFVCSGSTSIYCNNGSQLYGMTESVVGNRVTSLSDTVLGTGGTPSYDEFNRLSGMSYGARGQAFSYTYDRYGNRWSQNVTQGSGPSPQLSFSSTTNQVTTNTYDAAGNVVSDGTYSYTYDAEGNVTAVSGGTTATYVYDAYNHRVRQTTSSADVAYTFNTDGQRVAQWSETGTSPTLLASYTYWNGVPLATYVTSNQAVYYSHQDLLGTKRMTTTANSLEYGSYQSLPFGDGYTLTGSDPDASHFGLLDGDSETGSDHAQYRQLSTTQGRWFSPDPYDGSYDPGNPQSLNRYVYALNNPLVLIDPSGRDGGDGDCDGNGDCGDPCQYIVCYFDTSTPQAPDDSVQQSVTVYAGPIMDGTCFEDAGCEAQQQVQLLPTQPVPSIPIPGSSAPSNFQVPGFKRGSPAMDCTRVGGSAPVGGHCGYVCEAPDAGGAFDIPLARIQSACLPSRPSCPVSLNINVVPMPLFPLMGFPIPVKNSCVYSMN